MPTLNTAYAAMATAPASLLAKGKYEEVKVSGTVASQIRFFHTSIGQV